MWKKDEKHINKTMASNNNSGNNMFKQGTSNSRGWGTPNNNNVFRGGWGSAREPSAREQTNPFPQRPLAPVLHQEPVPEPPPAIIIDDFPALGGLSAKPKPVIAKSFVGAAKEGASIVKPEPVKKKPVVEETEQHNTNNVRSGRMRMTLAEYLERKEEGEQIDEDNVSICSEYSNNVIDGDSDDDYGPDDDAF